MGVSPTQRVTVRETMRMRATCVRMAGAAMRMAVDVMRMAGAAVVMPHTMRMAGAAVRV